jgi:hypothetical protein
MTIFAVLMPVPRQTLADAIRQAYPDDHLLITDTQWLISASGTVIDVTARLGIYDPKNPKAQSTGNAIVLSISSYYGRAPAIVWEWLKTKMETGSSGQR